MTCTVTLVPHEHHFRVMSVAADLLRPAVEKSGGRWTMGDLLRSFAIGRQQLWLAYDDEKNIKAAVTTMIQEYPSGNMLEIVFAGGKDAGEWLSNCFDIFKKYAKDCGCIGVEGVARRGFEPLFKKSGYKKPCAMYEYIFERKES